MSAEDVVHALETKLTIEEAPAENPPGNTASPGEPITTVEEWTDACTQAENDKETLVLQIGSDWCERCPAMHSCIEQLKANYQFKWIYSDAADTELTEHFRFTKLPAVVIFRTSEDEVWKAQAVSVDTVQKAVRATCPGVLCLDADF